MANIMHLIESLEFGGAEKVVVHLANSLSVEHQVSICLTKRHGELISELNDSIKVFCLHGHEGNDYSLPGEIRTLLYENKIDILNSHDWGVFIESALASRKFKEMKLIHTVHGPYTNYSQGLKSKLKIILRHLAERLLSVYVYKIITVSDSIRRYVQQDIKIKPELIQTIHNGIEDLGENIENRLNGNIRFIAVGRLAKVKNYELLLKAFSATLKTNTNFHLTIVGDGPEKNNLQKYCTLLGMDQYVSFLGFRNDIKELLIEHNVFVMSSDYEGISIALLESMSLSMPAIATCVGGIPETIIDNETGYLVPANDVSLYSSKIVKILNEPNTIVKMGSRAREYFVKEFNENVVLENYQSLYKECMESAK